MSKLHLLSFRPRVAPRLAALVALASCVGALAYGGAKGQPQGSPTFSGKNLVIVSKDFGFSYKPSQSKNGLSPLIIKGKPRIVAKLVDRDATLEADDLHAMMSPKAFTMKTGTLSGDVVFTLNEPASATEPARTLVFKSASMDYEDSPVGTRPGFYLICQQPFVFSSTSADGVESGSLKALTGRFHFVATTAKPVQTNLESAVLTGQVKMDYQGKGSSGAGAVQRFHGSAHSLKMRRAESDSANASYIFDMTGSVQVEGDELGQFSSDSVQVTLSSGFVLEDIETGDSTTGSASIKSFLPDGKTKKAKGNP